jgi:beta-glucosidase
MFEVERLLEELTLDEKALLLSGSDFWHTAPIERLGIPSIWCSDGPHGLRAQIAEADHLGLEGSVPATCFPTACALASSWDVDLTTEIGRALGKEAKRWGVSVVLGPGVNIKRSPLCGRNFEYYSEDPFLSGELGAAMVDGIQSQGVGASVKHYTANNQEDDRLRVSADVDERTLREIYLPAFERVVTSTDPWTVMCAYNRVNGVHASEHHWLLTEVLRDEWGWDGVVVSDWGAVHDRAAAVEAGLDWEMPPDLPRSPQAVVEAVRSGKLDQAAVGRSTRRMLQLVEKSLEAASGSASFDEVDHHRLARRAAAESVVLLKNEGRVLPLGTGTVAVVGEFARTPRFQGAGSSQVNPTRVDSPLEELEAQLGADSVRFAPGYRIEDDGDNRDLTAEAVAAAEEADSVVCFLGLPPSYESEGFDRTHLELPENQTVLLHALVAANANVVVVLVNGGVVRLSDWIGLVPAVLECWLGGQGSGGAIADVLTGLVNPSGRLAETIPHRLEDNLVSLNFPGDSGHVRYGEGVFVGYRAYDRLAREVTFPFGHGLSYTTFEMSELDIEASGTVGAGDLSATVEVSVTNTGDRQGAEVVQVYVGDPEASVARPPRELKAFTKISLEPGETSRVSLRLDQRAFSFWSPTLARWVVEAGEFTVSVGRSSRDLPLTHTIQIEAPSLAQPLTGWSTLHEWRADPIGMRLLDEMAPANSPLRDGELVRVLGTMPMSTLATFPGLGLDHDQLALLIEGWEAAGSDSN